MTEDESKQKWCPKVQVAASEGIIGSNRGDGGENFNCIASDCMMWVPYEYYSNGKGSAWSHQNQAKSLVKVVGGDCGLKRNCE